MTESSALVAAADDAAEAVRSINHLAFGGAIPAPVVYEVLGNLKCVGHMLPQTFRQLGQGLVASLTEYDVYDAEDTDPATSATLARSYLAEAAEKAAQLGRLLESAQAAISQQGYRTADATSAPQAAGPTSATPPGTVNE